MKTESVSTSAVMESAGITTHPKLRRFLQAYWLRPENAFWMTIRSDVLFDYALKPPSIDLGCGDGIFSFLHCGGVLDPDFDVFGAVAKLDRVCDDHADMFDHAGGDYQPKIVAPAALRPSVGTDIKTALLSKAERLGFYERLIRHDNNEPLPFSDDSFETVYCNSVYWVANVDGLLSEIARITRPGGRAVLQVKLRSMERYTLEAHRALLGDRFLDVIGRGRLATWKSLADRSTWEARFRTAGLVIEASTPFITATHAHIWDIGLRPLAPLLIRMTGSLDPAVRSSIKRDWVDLFHTLLSPLCNPDLNLASKPDEPAEVQYVLTPR